MSPQMKTFEEYMNEEPKFGVIKTFTENDPGHVDALSKFEKIRSMDPDDVIFYMYKWIQNNEISVETFKFLLYKLKDRK